MNIFVYSDESGVFDREHNEIFVFGGLIFLDGDCKDIANRKFIAAENVLRRKSQYYKKEELKACKIRPEEKQKLFRSLNQYIKFGVIVKQKKINIKIFEQKKSKQRYLDYAYKIALKRALKQLIVVGKIVPDKVENIYIYVDEHTTATDGKYELREGLEQEFKHGTFNYNYNKFFPPIFNNLKGVALAFCNSNKKPLIRAADIVANKLYNYTRMDKEIEDLAEKNFCIIVLP